MRPDPGEERWPVLSLPLGRISGRSLGMLVATMRRTPARVPLTRLFRKQLGIDALRALGPTARGPLPFSHEPLAARASHLRSSQELGLPPELDWPRSAASYARAYAAGGAQPEVLAAGALAAARALASLVPSLGPLCGYDDERALESARQSGERIRNEKARLLEGVPVCIKEEVDFQGLPTRLGTHFLGTGGAERDAVAVARLRAAGAVLIGQTPMTEFGLSPLGANTHRRMPRNPHDPGRLPGGSSSGSAVAVATGVTPLALGCDGGGSIRIPAALCGVFGLKPSYGRVPATGIGLPGATSVVHVGPIGASSRDLALFLEAAAGPDAGDSASLAAPPASPGEYLGALGRGVRGLRVGIDEDEWGDADERLVKPLREALRGLEREGAVLVDVKLGLARHAAAIGYLTIGIEAFAALSRIRATHMDDLGQDMQLFLAGIDTFAPDDYLDAQRIRAALRSELALLLADVDVLALPTTAQSAPFVSDDEARTGFIDPPALAAMCRYAFLANVCGVPAGTAPVGVDPEGMPVGLQIVGDAWDEPAVLQVLAHLERAGIARPLRPEAGVDLLSGAGRG